MNMGPPTATIQPGLPPWRSLRRRRNDHFLRQVRLHVDCSDFEAIETWSFGCECADEACCASVALTLVEYEAISAPGISRLITAPEHEPGAGFAPTATTHRFTIASMSP